ncbi:hypothetical protein J5X84_29410 [Streptosporangiaceae bacterium NEAU-GS5]|nr:hypothetical protein [Streptosporangiaceae bacterium NEAU-GS5]
MTFHGVKLNYLLTVPAGFPNTIPAPVVLNYHGLGSNATQQDAYTRFPIAGANLGYIIATPETVTGLPGWVLPGFGHSNDPQIEIRAATALLDQVESVLCVDTKREFAAGMSNGAGMATALICGLDGRLAAVAPVSGINLAKPCATPRPTSIITFHGTADRVVPYEGGRIGLPRVIGRYQVPAWLQNLKVPAVQATVELWAGRMSCAGKPASSAPAADVTLRTYQGCAGGATVEQYVVDGGGHTWPGGVRLGALGKTATLDATGLIFQAFGQHAATR